MSTFNLRNGLRLLGIGALLIGVFTAALLYYSFRTTFAECAVKEITQEERARDILALTLDHNEGYTDG